MQLSNDRPSHIIWPALHHTREDIARLFREHHHTPQNSDDVAGMVASARRQLRGGFLGADVGISGANFLIADSGAICTVTNEGNAELTTTIPRVHIVTAGIEKLVPSLTHAFILLRLLVRSATGADITQYTTFDCGPRSAGDRDGRRPSVSCWSTMAARACWPRALARCCAVCAAAPDESLRSLQ